MRWCWLYLMMWSLETVDVCQGVSEEMRGKRMGGDMSEEGRKEGEGLRGGQQLFLEMFSLQDEPLAVCNDGSPGGFYFSSAADPSQTDVFVVYLPGGGQCWDEASCSARDSSYMSSADFPPSRTVYGILDSDPRHTPLWGANKAYLGYCSSDGYMGDVAASDKTWGLHFRGISLVKAMVRALDAYGLQSASRIYVVGSSAGGRGAMVHIDSLVSSQFPSDTKVIGFLDSPYYLDIDPYSSDFQGFAYQEQQKYNLYNTSGIIDADCAAVFPEEQWKCQFGQYRMPFVDTPYFMIASQYDSYQLSNNIQDDPSNYDDEMMSYATAFGQKVRDDLSELVTLIGSSNPSKNYGYALFSWACYNHAVASSSSFYTSLTTEGVSQKNAFEQYLSRSPASGTNMSLSDSFVMTWIDSCTEFACDGAC